MADRPKIHLLYLRNRSADFDENFHRHIMTRTGPAVPRSRFNVEISKNPRW